MTSASSWPPAAGAWRRFAPNRSGRDLVVGDIHGAYSVLHEGLRAIGFDPRVDRLFSVGDLVDRGPESAQVLDWLDRPWFHAICGNHDFMAWRAALGDPYTAVDRLRHGGAWLDALVPDDRQRIGERLAALPIVIEVETGEGTIGLVHADCPFDDWFGLRAVDWRQIDLERGVGHACLWSGERHARRYDGVVKNIRAVVHGHTTVRSIEVLGNVYYLDTGGWLRGGRFSFLDLGTLLPVRAHLTASVPRKAGRR